nr:MAG TPA: hypothetical protein [Caudoviricetes sp.]
MFLLKLRFSRGWFSIALASKRTFVIITLCSYLCSIY